MSMVKIKLNSQGIKSYLKSESVKNMLEDHANNSLSKLGEGYEKTAHTGKTRVNVSIRASTRESIVDNANNNSILKSLKG